MNYYELIIRYDRSTTDYVVFKDKRMALSSKGIIDIAIQKDIIDEEMREMLKEELSEAKKNVEELEKELFGSLEKEPDDRFYTFNQKNNAFQELLDKEKERVRSLEDEYNKQLAEMDYTWVPDIFPAKAT